MRADLISLSNFNHWTAPRLLCSCGRPALQGRACHGSHAQPSCAAACADGEEAALPQPRVPLCERPAAHSVELAALLSWHQAALRRIADVGDSWARQDDGPTQEDLATELTWLLDDAVAGEHSAAAEASAPRAARLSWRALQRELGGSGSSGGELGARHILLRESLQGLEALWARRVADRTPLQYLTAAAFWRDMVLSVGPGVLIPRPETELIVDYVAEAVRGREELGLGQWADLGTGSGALAIGIALALPAAPAVWAVDLSPAAVAHAAFNARRMGVKGRVRVARGSWYEPLLAAGVSRLAGIVSNPPYIPSAQMAGLQAEVGRHEPRSALDGGDGMGIDCLVRICQGAAVLLQPGGFLALETAGGEQGEYVADVLRRMRDGSGGGDGGGGECCAFEDVLVRQDLRGVGRFVTASRRV